MSMTDAEIAQVVAQHALEMRERGFLQCYCNNWVKVGTPNCPYCRANLVTRIDANINQCPVCGQNIQHGQME